MQINFKDWVPSSKNQRDDAYTYQIAYTINRKRERGSYPMLQMNFRERERERRCNFERTAKIGCPLKKYAVLRLCGCLC